MCNANKKVVVRHTNKIASLKQIQTLSISLETTYRVCICGEMETDLHLFLHSCVRCAARTALHNKDHDILNETDFAERFERLGHTDLLILYLHGVPDAPIAVSVAIFNAVDEFLKCCDRFQ